VFNASGRCQEAEEYGCRIADELKTAENGKARISIVWQCHYDGFGVIQRVNPQKPKKL